MATAGRTCLLTAKACRSSGTGLDDKTHAGCLAAAKHHQAMHQTYTDAGARPLPQALSGPVRPPTTTDDLCRMAGSGSRQGSPTVTAA